MKNKITESRSNYTDIDKMSTRELLNNINREDQKVALSIQEVIPQIEALVDAVVGKMEIGGRLIYIGAGTSGRLGVIDASECPPTFGVAPDKVCGIMAGGDQAIRTAVEGAEDDIDQAWKDLKEIEISKNDFVVGISASGSTPYVYHGLKKCREEKIGTGSISCNPNAICSEQAEFPIEIVVGPEFVSGSTRMKSGTAQKLALNMLSTSVMIQLGHVEDNQMIDMQLSNQKLVDRGTKMIMEKLNTLSYEEAKNELLAAGSVRKALQKYSGRDASDV